MSASNVPDLVEEETPTVTQQLGRIGTSYQAVIPPLIRNKTELMEEKDPAPYWKPTDKCTDKELAAFVKLANQLYNYNHEQALFLLFMVNYDLKKGRMELFKFYLRLKKINEKAKSRSTPKHGVVHVKNQKLGQDVEMRQEELPKPKVTYARAKTLFKNK